MATRHLTTRSAAHDPVAIGALWMLGISLALFFLPAVNGLIGGAVGGWRVGSPGRALGAAVLPAVGVGVGLWVLLALLDAPVVGLFAGAAVGLFIALAELGLFVGAFFGGLAASLSRTRARPA